MNIQTKSRIVFGLVLGLTLAMMVAPRAARAQEPIPPPNFFG